MMQQQQLPSSISPYCGLVRQPSLQNSGVSTGIAFLRALPLGLVLEAQCDRR